MTNSVEPRVYAACLSSYNNGVLHGAWIDATQGEDEMEAAIAVMLLGSKYPNVTVMCLDCAGDGFGDRNLVTGPWGCFACPWCKGSGRRRSAEEWAIHDHEGLGDVGEYTRLSEIVQRVAVVDVANDRGIPAVVLFEAMESRCALDGAQDFVDNHSQGEARSWADWAEQWHEDCGMLEGLPDWVRYHVDWTSVGRDMEHSNFSVEHNGTMYIFSEG
jgi:antirestriction protein